MLIIFFLFGRSFSIQMCSSNGKQREKNKKKKLYFHHDAIITIKYNVMCVCMKIKTNKKRVFLQRNEKHRKKNEKKNSFTQMCYKIYVRSSLDVLFRVRTKPYTERASSAIELNERLHCHSAKKNSNQTTSYRRTTCNKKYTVEQLFKSKIFRLLISDFSPNF